MPNLFREEKHYTCVLSASMEDVEVPQEADASTHEGNFEAQKAYTDDELARARAARRCACRARRERAVTEARAVSSAERHDFRCSTVERDSYLMSPRLCQSS